MSIPDLMPYNGIMIKDDEKSQKDDDATLAKANVPTGKLPTGKLSTGKLVERGGPKGPEPTRFGDWESGGRCTDF